MCGKALHADQASPVGLMILRFPLMAEVFGKLEVFLGSLAAMAAGFFDSCSAG